ncbi:hypothetical protein VC36_07075 [Pseudomonas marginalis]|nr:hypothetical protein VC37_03295 [Pseudomonas marginalis]KJZ61229.1 hypothetical protein VC36_07075 [Pseudomonas marginalis]
MPAAMLAFALFEGSRLNGNGDFAGVLAASGKESVEALSLRCWRNGLPVVGGAIRVFGGGVMASGVEGAEIFNGYAPCRDRR